MLDIVSTRMLGQFGFLAKVRLFIPFIALSSSLLISGSSRFSYLCGCIGSSTCRSFQFLRIWESLLMLLPLVRSVSHWPWIHQSFGAENLFSRQEYGVIHIVFHWKPWLCIFIDSCLPIGRLYVIKADRANSILLWQELDRVVEELENIAVVNLLQNRSIISLIGNVQYSSLILEKVCTSLLLMHVNHLIRHIFQISHL